MANLIENHILKAISTAVRVAPETPKAGQLNVWTNGHAVHFSASRAVLQRLQHQIAQALDQAPLPPRRAKFVR